MLKHVRQRHGPVLRMQHADRAHNWHARAPCGRQTLQPALVTSSTQTVPAALPAGTLLRQPASAWGLRLLARCCRERAPGAAGPLPRQHRSVPAQPAARRRRPALCKSRADAEQHRACIDSSMQERVVATLSTAKDVSSTLTSWDMSPPGGRRCTTASIATARPAQRPPEANSTLAGTRSR